MCLQGAEGPHTAAAFAKLQQRTQALQQRAAAATAKLEQQRQQVAEASAAAKVRGRGLQDGCWCWDGAAAACQAGPLADDCCASSHTHSSVSLPAVPQDGLRKCEALPAFKPGGAPGDDAQALLQRQPLEPALGALR